MGHDVQLLEATFTRLGDGDDDALLDFIELHRHELFDYVLRMTGQTDRALATVDELSKSMQGTARRAQGSGELRMKLFATARRFNADAWGAETSHLVNFALEGNEDPVSISPGSEAAHDDTSHKNHLLALDQCLRSLAATERELLWLSSVAELPTADVAQIVDMSERQVAASLGNAWTIVGAQCNIGISDAQTLMPALLLHPLPGSSESSTVAISQMIGSLSETSKLRTRQRLRRLAMFLLVVTAGAYVAWFMGWFRW